MVQARNASLPLVDIALTAQALKASGGAERYTRDVIA